MRLNVVGVNSWRFFPRLVARLTSLEEFHSVNHTWTLFSSSHRFSR